MAMAAPSSSSSTSLSPPTSLQTRRRRKAPPLLQTRKKLAPAVNWSAARSMLHLKAAATAGWSATGGSLAAVGAAEEEGDKIRRLQNGPDVRGVALDDERGRPVDLTPQVVAVIAESFGDWLRTKELAGNGCQLRVSFGRDPRLSGPQLCAGLVAGLSRAGCAVFDMGLATTPACFMSAILPPFNYDASIMMTASHLHYTRNGLKFFTRRGGLRSGEVEWICDRAASKYAAAISGGGFSFLSAPPAATRVDFMSAYAGHLRRIIVDKVAHPSHPDAPLRGFKIVVNAGNGSGGFFAWDVLEKLGADTTGSLHLDPDGAFPNHIPNPEDPTAMALTQDAVLRHGADLGVVFDTDVDRSGVVDSTGAAINGDRLIALMSAIVLREHPRTTVVTDARASVGLTEFIARRGGRHCLYRVGYRNVIDKGIRLNGDGVETHLMMETTGHGALKENFFLDDGAYMVVKIIIEMVRMRMEGRGDDIGSLIGDLVEPADSVELRMNVLSPPQQAKDKGAHLVQALANLIQDGEVEGWELDACGDCWVSDGCLVDDDIDIDAYMYRLKVSNEGQHGWAHIRQSVHSPSIVLNMQSTDKGGCRSMVQTLMNKFLLKDGVREYLDIGQVISYAEKGIKN